LVLYGLLLSGSENINFNFGTNSSIVTIKDGDKIIESKHYSTNSDILLLDDQQFRIITIDNAVGLIYSIGDTTIIE